MDIHLPLSVANQVTTLVTNARRFTGRALLPLYTTTAVVVLDIVVLLIAANLALGAVYMIRDAKNRFHPEPPATLNGSAVPRFNVDGSPLSTAKRNEYQMAWIDFQAYGVNDPAYVADVLDDFYDLGKAGMAYQPWVEFAEPAFKGKRVTVEPDLRGFLTRHTVNPVNDAELPVVKVFTLGGSTTFGYNVSDEHTWPSYLSQILNERARAQSLGIHIEVVNYGRGFYYPSQETVLLMDLLKSGHRPQVAIFLDGVNTGATQDVPEFYDRIKDQFHNIQFTENREATSSVLDTLRWIPFVRLAKALSPHLSGNKPPTVAQRESLADSQAVTYQVNMFRQSRDLAGAICQLYSVAPIFVLQPHAIYNYPTDLYRRSLPDDFFKWRSIATGSYNQMRSDPGVLYLGDLFESWGHDKKAIIDEVHYSPAFHRFLAERLANQINLKALDPHRPGNDESAASGSVRRRV